MILFYWSQETARVTSSKTHIEGPGHGLRNSICVPILWGTFCVPVSPSWRHVCLSSKCGDPVCVCPHHREGDLSLNTSHLTLRVSCLHLTPCLQASPHDSGHLSTVSCLLLAHVPQTSASSVGHSVISPSSYHLPPLDKVMSLSMAGGNSSHPHGHQSCTCQALTSAQAHSMGHPLFPLTTDPNSLASGHRFSCVLH